VTGDSGGGVGRREGREAGNVEDIEEYLQDEGNF